MTEILTIQNDLETLRRKSLPVDDFKLAESVCRKLYNFVDNPKNKALGLAAIQIGMPLRIFAAQVPKRNGFRKKTMIFVNPEIIYSSDIGGIKSEICLSEPGIEREVFRSSFIRIKFQNERGEIFNYHASELIARIIQHEIDHFEGILLIDKKET